MAGHDLGARQELKSVSSGKVNFPSNPQTWKICGFETFYHHHLNKESDIFSIFRAYEMVPHLIICESTLTSKT